VVVTKGRPKENTNNRRRDDVESGEEERKRKRFHNNFKNPKHSPYFFFVGKDPKKLVEKLEKSHTKNIDTRSVSNISRTRIRHGICKRMGVSPKR